MKKVFVYGNRIQLKNYERSILSINALPIISEKLTYAVNCDCLLLAGGGDVYPEFYGKKDKFCKDKNLFRDLNEFSLITHFINKNANVLGICRGLQVLNVYFLGTLNQKIKRQNLHFSQDGDRYHHIKTIDNCTFSKITSTLNIVNSAHRQSIDKLGKGLTPIAFASDGTIEAVKHESLKIFAVQFHPERLIPPHDYYGLQLLSYCLGI